METQTQPQKEQKPTTEALIQTEWDTIKHLQQILADRNLSIKERTGAASVLAFHVNTLNRILIQTGKPEEFSEQTLADYVRTVEPRIARHLCRDYRRWKRALSSRRY